MSKVNEYFLLVKREALKINWPSRKQVARSTLIVVITSAFVAALLGSLDYVFGIVFRKLILGI